jgi:hypothetical protein
MPEPQMATVVGKPQTESKAQQEQIQDSDQAQSAVR